MPYLLALDEGTSSARAIVFTDAGGLVAEGRQSFQQHFPQPGWVEHDPLEIWHAQLEAGKEALAKAGVHPRDIAAIGITNQRETTVLWDRATGKPVHKAIVWQDRRTAPLCAQLKADGKEALIRQKTGLLLDPYFSATKLRWLLDHLPNGQARAENGELAFGTIDTWLLWQLTGGEVHATDASNAARTLLYNLHTGAWDDELLRLFNLPAVLFPEIRSSDALFAATTVFGGEVPIHGVLGDQQAATFGQACFAPGDAKNTYGTGCFLLQNTGADVKASTHGLLSTVAWQLGGARTYALEGAVFSAGASLQWLQESGIVTGPREAAELAARLPDNGDVYFVPAFAGLGAPQWDPAARGAVVGLSRGTGKAHLARAALEAMAFQSDEILEAFAQDSGLPIAALRVDGGAAQNDFLLQFQADLTGTPVWRPAHLERTAWGAAAIAGYGAGQYTSLADLAALQTEGQVFTPNPTAGRARLRTRWQDAVRRSLGWAL